MTRPQSFKIIQKYLARGSFLLLVEAREYLKDNRNIIVIGRKNVKKKKSFTVFDIKYE